MSFTPDSLFIQQSHTTRDGGKLAANATSVEVSRL
jgi:hypothetical protein